MKLIEEHWTSSQVRLAKQLEYYAKAVRVIAEKYGGISYVFHDSVQIDIPKEHIEAAMAEITALNK